MSFAKEILAEITPPKPLDAEVVQLRRDLQDYSRTPWERPNPAVAKYHPFEVYITGFTSALLTTAKIKVATGTVIADGASVSATSITGADTEFNLSSGDWVYLETSFSAGGSIISCELKVGTWGGYPSLYLDDGAGANTWFHPIAQCRAPHTGKSAGHPDAPFPDPGEFPVMAGLHIAQKTNTHLAAVKVCIAGNPAHKLEPGPGGAD